MKRTQLAELEIKYDALKDSHTKLVEALEKIKKCEGVYSRDKLTHANNVIESHRQKAEQALDEAEKV